MAILGSMAIVLWHNPRCGKSRKALELLRARGIEPAIREYLKEPPSRAEVETLIRSTGGDLALLVRADEPEFRKAGLARDRLSVTTIVKAVVAHPILLQRPIAVAGKRAIVGRPPEAVLALVE